MLVSLRSFRISISLPGPDRHSRFFREAYALGGPSTYPNSRIEDFASTTPFDIWDLEPLRRLECDLEPPGFIMICHPRTFADLAPIGRTIRRAILATIGWALLATRATDPHPGPDQGVRPGHPRAPRTRQGMSRTGLGLRNYRRCA